MRNVAIIAARGGSKGLPGKNLLPLLGVPLVSWTVKQALTAGIFDEVVITSDSAEISIEAQKAGAKYLFDRPAELASDSATSVDAILHALDSLGPEKFDIVTYLECTSPLRMPGDIANTVKALTDNIDEFDASVAVCKVKQHPAIMLRRESRSLLPLGTVQKQMVRRQDLAEIFHPFGGIYCIKVSKLQEFKTFYPDRLTGYELQDFQAFEVDDLIDFTCIEAVLKHYKQFIELP